jgi:hypothetical protein
MAQRLLDRAPGEMNGPSSGRGSVLALLLDTAASPAVAASSGTSPLSALERCPTCAGLRSPRPDSSEESSDELAMRRFAGFRESPSCSLSAAKRRCPLVTHIAAVAPIAFSKWSAPSMPTTARLSSLGSRVPLFIAVFESLPHVSKTNLFALTRAITMATAPGPGNPGARDVPPTRRNDSFTRPPAALLLLDVLLPAALCVGLLRALVDRATPPPPLGPGPNAKGGDGPPSRASPWRGSPRPARAGGRPEPVLRVRRLPASERTTDVLLRLKTSWLGDNRRSCVALTSGCVHVPGGHLDAQRGHLAADRALREVGGALLQVRP